ncbi:conserved hypothetical protein [Neospora caninum Liverpool]|uniref:BTB/POZ domain-containing protein n=2 Tax=Sarcocystidae TaxID=5809 RepID=F0VPS3_NEOCL|nr:conserved hypothetical protein [Neospora caninum Liverpool]CBZ55720.1 conserved hypothetical protein [Neospora caninum Liverpool]CEL70462.1 TPA: BTB/POZ domain-containing protein [Neospora caninum Liverpool]|eukprot:XP_003885746.1 conserved hypothetical protein [Neospora caninum Liverpool]
MMHPQVAGVVVASGLDSSSLLSSRQAKQGNPLARLRTFQQSIHRLLTDPAFETLFDVVIVAEGKELRAHQCILSACSEYFKRLFCGPDTAKRIEFQQRWVVVQQLVRCMYGADIEPGTDPEIILEVLAEARNLEVNCISIEDCVSLIVDQLSVVNCARVLTHDEVAHHRELSRQVCSYIVKRFSDVVRNPTSRQQLLQMPRNQIVYMVRELCRRCDTNRDTDLIVRFVVDWSQFETACDLLRDCKLWDWSIEPGALSVFRDEDQNALQAPSMPQAVQWRIPNLRVALREQLPMKYVVGTYFDWSVRLDHGGENKLRIVYESALDRNPGQPACIKRFPAALFAWQVIFRGEDVFRERPVFICFPEHVALHWSTTLPISTADVTDGDELTILVTMTEVPLVSLILYYFSSDLNQTLAHEDILNRLPHIEYRCLSSYTLFHSAQPQPGAPGL